MAKAEEYRILSIDGGGIRGLISTIILQRIIKEGGLDNFLDSIDLIAGTSTGGLLALGIAYNLDLEKIKALYIEEGPKIFDDTWLDDLIDLGKLVGADYHTKNRRRALEDLFGDTTLGQLKKRVLITTFDLDNEGKALKLANTEKTERRTWKPKLFHNFPGENSDEKSFAADVGLYTSAAPTYFPSVDGFIDGGVYANNPSMCALAQTQDERYEPNPPLNNIYLLSLGTGMSLQYIEGDSHDWGYVQWRKPLLHLVLDGAVGIADYQCKQMLRTHYHRLEPVFEKGVTVPLDGVDKIPYMIKFAEELDIRDTLEWLQETWKA